MGKRRLESAIASARADTEFEGVEFDVRWRPFQLNENAPKGKGVNKMNMYIEKFGQARVNAMLPQMKQVGNTEGIKFSYGGYTGNTLDSHRVIWKAREDGGSLLQDKVVESLFKAYFEEEQSLGEPSVLINCAERAGMDASTIFEGDDNIGKKETFEELQHYRRAHSVTGVPFFIFDEKYTFSGAQTASEIMSVFKKLL